MAEAGSPGFFNTRARGDWVRLRTLVVLRWIAITGQSAAVLVAGRLLGFAIPLSLCALVISAAVCVNLAAYYLHPAEKRLSERGTLLSLAFDLMQLGILLMLTGGLNNPFAMLILAPVTISATALRIRSTLALGLVALALIPLLELVHLPLITGRGTPLEVPGLYRLGLGAGLATGIVFLALYARRITVEVYRMSEALSATQLALAREQRLAAIGGVAAATAHELGTPLATIKLVAGELARELEGDPQLADDARLIREQADRCGEIMADLSRTGRQDAHVRHAPISAVVEEAAEPHAGRGKQVIVRYGGLPVARAGGEQPEVARTPELIHGLRNLVQNAVDFAQSTVWIDISEREGGLRIAVGDDGPGFSADILPRLGEPYISTRARGGRERGGDPYEGMGLGLFIARTLLERTGGQIAFANGADSRRRRKDGSRPVEVAQPPGAIIEIVWPPGTLVVSRQAVRGPLGRNPPEDAGHRPEGDLADDRNNAADMQA
ncbi:ActS/PrrB/RegB family redox-sensitive histidine kinase [Paralimibaculum aggregatum]|uniref:histidine kinase n=1 Tax=Paralimibaculum aggregatum TaxID=3036245 RepID=A0ABQ6LHZ8_9RHOB|nr:ActS/PrrB/RegB family redox-sensitive histidine kinase [Limibaculum sp. NKW23]GMG82909.1 ActS/PrrB/RegB family redox-sensitive histidine kinase [Limibaculum sp. NKW23]